MKKINIYIMIALCISSYLSAKDIKSLNLSFDNDTILKNNTTKATLIATTQTGESKNIDKNITWITTPKHSIRPTDKNIIMPIQDTVITIKAKYNNTISNPVTLNVKWTVNGYTLPPEPNKKVNNSTLLGIDVNNNGVRDDVERWIYETYHHPIERGIFMQSARVFQILIKDPSKALETAKYEDKYLSCWKYWTGKKNNENFSIDYYRSLSKEIKPVQLNTAKRYIAYDRYNSQFNGMVFDGTIQENKNNCEFDNNGNLR